MFCLLIIEVLSTNSYDQLALSLSGLFGFLWFQLSIRQTTRLRAWTDSAVLIIGSTPWSHCQLSRQAFILYSRSMQLISQSIIRPGGGVATGFSCISNHKCKNGFSDFSVIKKQRLLLLANFQASNIGAFSLEVK